MRRWTLPGFAGLPIHGETDLPEGQPRACAIIVHGFMGYGTYGFMPWLGRSLAKKGLIVHRPTLSTSGINPETRRFEHGDRFERQTWNAQVEDLRLVLESVRAGELGEPFDACLVIGHSRGGVVSLLAAGRSDGAAEFIHGVVTIAAPDTCCSMSESDRAMMLDHGRKQYVSGRTGEELWLGRAWLDEQLADPAGHDVPAVVAKIRVPMLLIHGSADPTVDHRALATLAECAGDRATSVLIAGADHVLNTPNPFEPDATPSQPLLHAWSALEAFLDANTEPKENPNAQDASRT